jgi:HemY protein
VIDVLRVIGLLVLVAAAMLAAVWLADRPGQVSIVWQGWRIDTSFGLLLVSAFGVAVAAIFLAAVWRGLVTGPRRFMRWRRDRRRRQGYSALTRGLVAVAAGDPQEARRHARRADVLLDEPPLTMLLAAQTAQLIGDEDEARRHFRRMLEKPDTEFLGLRGLITQALKSGAHGEALELARRARLLRPQTAWVQTTLFELESRNGDWRAAQETLRQAARIGAVPPATARRHEAAVALERSRAPPGTGANRRRWRKPSTPGRRIPSMRPSRPGSPSAISPPASRAPRCASSSRPGRARRMPTWSSRICARATRAIRWRG